MPPDVELPLLVRAAASGDQAAWDALVERYAPLVWAVARGHGLPVQTSADVAQTAWLRLVESIDSVPAEQLGCWLAAGTRTEALHALRWADPRLEVQPRRAPPAELLQALRTVPARSRLALRLLAVPAVTMPEIAAGTGLDVVDAEALVAESLRRLAAELDKPLASTAPREATP